MVIREHGVEGLSHPSDPEAVIGPGRADDVGRYVGSPERNGGSERSPSHETGYLTPDGRLEPSEQGMRGFASSPTKD